MAEAKDIAHDALSNPNTEKTVVTLKSLVDEHGNMVPFNVRGSYAI